MRLSEWGTSDAKGRSTDAALPHFLRLLWNIAPPILALPVSANGDPPVPHLSPAGLHLPAPPRELTSQSARDWSRAAAAHAAAHLVFSRRIFSRHGVAPITQALVDLLEDARVEALAMRALPGLRRLWACWHVTTPADGDGVTSLFARLARVLADPNHDDPHPWVRKGRSMFYLDAAGEVVAPVQGLSLRRMASALGHDLGQMRRAFDSRAHRIVPTYRDDNRWMWQADAQDTQRARPQAIVGSGNAREALPDGGAPPPRSWHYPEWDARIGRLRRDWCRVVEEEPIPTATPAWPQPMAGFDALLRQSLQLLARAPGHRERQRALDGHNLDLDAAIDAVGATRHRLPVDPRVYRRRMHSSTRCAVTMLLDCSASGAEWLPGQQQTVLQQTQAVAAALTAAAVAMGWAVAVQGFCSDGRRHVRHWRVLDAGAPWDDAARARLWGLRAGLSTRLGTAVRHATQDLVTRPESRRFLWVIGDAQPHDIDIHEPGYLVEDALQAVKAAHQAGVCVGALLIGAEKTDVAQRVFGRGGWTRVNALAGLRAALLSLRSSL